jgi:hypothetical protein
MVNNKKISIHFVNVLMVGFSLYAFIQSFNKPIIYSIISFLGLTVFLSFLIFQLGFAENLRKKIFGK